MQIWDTLLDLIKRDKENAQAKTGHPSEPYWSIIDAALAKQRSEPVDLHEDKVHKVPVYVVRMCESLVKAIKANGNPDVTVAEVISVELNASGHSDYHRKFALYCFELAQKKPR